MHQLFGLVFAAAAALVVPSGAAPLVVGGDSRITFGPDNVLGGIQPPPKTDSILSTANPMKLNIINNFNSSSNLTAYVTGRDTNNAVVFLSTSGTWLYPDPQNNTVPVAVAGDVALAVNGPGQTTEFTLPDYISAARVWVAEGQLDFFTVSTAGGTQLVEPAAPNPSDPSSKVNWGFAELTYNTDGMYANISFVDFVGLVMGMRLTLGGGDVQTVRGLTQDAVTDICNDLKAQAGSDGQPWDQLCVTDASGKELRVLSPAVYVDITPGAFTSYWDAYVDQVWEKYSSQNLSIDTQSSPGTVNCTVADGVLTCDGDSRPYDKPAGQDIFGCSAGAFALSADDNDVHHAVVPRLCAAFHRATLLLDGGGLQPGLNSTSYYTESPCNHYSRIIHTRELDGRGYAFSYDDVNPAGQNEAGAVWGPAPTLLEIAIGGFS